MRLALIALSLLVSCTTPATPQTTPSTRPSSTASGTNVSPTPTQLSPLTLMASLDEPAVDWARVAFLPAGNAENEVGFEPCSDCVLHAPAALAVAQDGSFWIAYPLKRRIAHFSSDGSVWAMATVDPVTGQVTPAAGAQVSGHRFMDFVPLLDTPEADYEIRWSDGERTSEQRAIRFQLRQNGRQLRTSVGDTYVRTSTSTGFVTLVNLAGQQGLPVGGGISTSR
jgi:hypothetical protein